MTNQVSPEQESKIRPNLDTVLVEPSLDDMRENKYAIVISPDDGSDEIVYPIFEFEHPGISVTPIDIPFQMNTPKVPSNTINYGDVTITFALNTEMTLYFYILAEMSNSTTNHLHKRDMREKYQKGENGAKDMIDRRKTLSLLIYDNNNNVIRKIVYVNCFFESLGGLKFRSTTGSPAILTCSATFSIDWFDFEE